MREKESEEKKDYFYSKPSLQASNEVNSLVLFKITLLAVQFYFYVGMVVVPLNASSEAVLGSS